MGPFIQQIIAHGDANRILSGHQLARVIGGSEDHRYRQINKALRSGELVKIRRSLFVLSDPLRDYPVYTFSLAQHIRPGSYISAETALGFHGWIPEAVHTVLSVINKGNSFDEELGRYGHFEFSRLGVQRGYFLQGVVRHEFHQQVALVAEPMRALMDLMALRKQPWEGLGFLLDGMRIDEDALMTVPSVRILQLLDVYKGKRERHFIESLLQALGLAK